MKPMKLVIIGGVAGGASCAVRARRLNENAEIIIFERGPYVSFANCGLPYYVGNVIKEEAQLLVASPELFFEWFNIEVRTESRVTVINRDNQTVAVEDTETGEIYTESYDRLVLSPGAQPIRPPLPGIDQEGIYTLRNIPDTKAIMANLARQYTKKAAVIGGGFIGLEMAENLNTRGVDVTIIEMLQQVMPPLDAEMAIPVQEHLRRHNISLKLGRAVTGFEKLDDGTIDVCLVDGEKFNVDLVILAIGIRPEVELARDAGLEIGKFGGIVVNDRMQTADPKIWAVGDAVETRHFITGEKILLPLAGPANRQGRFAADCIMEIIPEETKFRGVQATSVCGVVGLTVASTGLNEKTLKTIVDSGASPSYEKIYLHPENHAGYYPGSQTITMKLLFSRDDGTILGAQAVGMAGVEKRIDVIAMAIQKHGTVFDLAEAELCYAPQYGSAKDPVNMAGMIAGNVLQELAEVRHWENLGDTDALILDVRERGEHARGRVPGSVNIPLGELRRRLNELPKDREIWSHCYVGQRSYYASRILKQHGFRAANISGGYMMYELVNKTQR
jgi:NADPH-dependent 2,4-dienoyl-CoA reductase/sulfur reductase-like enzyme/rhodanese-related sulfurtransferase